MEEIHPKQTQSPSTDFHPKWRSWNVAISTIREIGWQRYAEQFHDSENALEDGDRIVRCIDGRTPGDLHLAGAGALAGPEQTILFLKKSGATGITSHKDCGAVRIMMSQRGISGDQEKITRDFAKKIAAEAEIDYMGHLPVSGPHEERCVYYVGAESFDYSRASMLPKGFTISRRYLDSTYALQEAEIAIGIAFGSHGFGDLFTVDNPFLLIAIGENSNQSMTLQKELARVAAKHGGRVLVAPK